MSEVEFSMDPMWIDAIERGDKVCTTRTKRKCDVGDTFPLHGRTYRVIRIVQLPLWDAVHTYYAKEGFRSEQEFRDALSKYYEVDDSVRVWTHFFEEVRE